MRRGVYVRWGVVVALLGLLVLVGATEVSAASIGDQPPGVDNATTNGTVEVVFFYSPGCPHCANVEEFIADHRNEYDFTVEKYAVREHTELLVRYLRQYDVPRRQWGAVPTVFVGEEYAIGDRPAIALLEEKFRGSTPTTDPRTKAGPDTTVEPETTTRSKATVETDTGVETATAENDTTVQMSDDIDGRTLLTLAGLAAADAVNPCALAVLIVLLTTILTRHPDRHGQVFTAGVSFALAVGVTYAAIGVLLVFGLKSVPDATTVQISGIRRAFGVLAIGMGLLNVKDGISHGAGGFAIEVPGRFRPSMQRYLTRPLWSQSSVVVGAALAGIGVSLFLLPCTAGPYVVAGGLLADVPWQNALPLLGAYNLVFVFPMIAISAAVAGGFATADAVGDWRESHLETLHLVAGMLLIGLGSLLAVGMI